MGGARAVTVCVCVCVCVCVRACVNGWVGVFNEFLISTLYKEFSNFDSEILPV